MQTKFGFLQRKQVVVVFLFSLLIKKRVFSPTWTPPPPHVIFWAGPIRLRVYHQQLEPSLSQLWTIGWESTINIWFPFMYSQKWNCAASLFPKQIFSPHLCNELWPLLLSTRRKLANTPVTASPLAFLCVVWPLGRRESCPWDGIHTWRAPSARWREGGSRAPAAARQGPYKRVQTSYLKEESNKSY